MIDALEQMICPACGIRYAVPQRYIGERRAKGGDWWCPNGHALAFVETEVDKLRRQLKERELFWEREAGMQAEQAEIARGRLASAKREATRLKKRLANGVCPCCHRSFVDLRRHMSVKHPDFADV